MRVLSYQPAAGVLVLAAVCGCRPAQPSVLPPNSQPVVRPTGADYLGRLNCRLAYDPNAPGRPVIAIDVSESVTDADLRQLREIKSLRSLNLSGAKKTTPAAIKEIAALSDLQELWLGPAQATDSCLSAIQGLSSLRRLEVGGQGVTDTGIQHLRGLKNLQTLNLQNTAVTDAAPPDLAAMTELRMLTLDSTGITDAGLTHLATLPNLVELRLQGCKISDKGLATLREHRQLSRLFLASPQVRRSREPVQRVEGPPVLYRPLTRMGESAGESPSAVRTHASWPRTIA